VVDRPLRRRPSGARLPSAPTPSFSTRTSGNAACNGASSKAVRPVVGQATRRASQAAADVGRSRAPPARRARQKARTRPRQRLRFAPLARRLRAQLSPTMRMICAANAPSLPSSAVGSDTWPTHALRIGHADGHLGATNVHAGYRRTAGYDRRANASRVSGVIRTYLWKGVGVGSTATVVVLQPHDVVFTQVAAKLHFQQLPPRRWSGRQAGAPGPRRCRSAGQRPGRTPARPGDAGGALGNHPVLGALAVLLQAELLARCDLDALDLARPQLRTPSRTNPRALGAF